MNDLPLLPDQPTAIDHLRRFGFPALIAVVALLFIVQNTRTASFAFLWFDFRWPLWIMLLVFMSLGAGIAYAISRRRRFRKARAAKRADKASKLMPSSDD